MDPTHVAPVVVTRYGQPTSNLPIIYPVISEAGAIDWALYLHWHLEIAEWSFIVPSGSITNLGTIPWWCRWLISPTDAVIVIPAIGHDYLVNEADFVITNIATGAVAKREDIHIPWRVSAQLFLAYRAQFRSWKPRLKLLLVYAAIRLYGMYKKEP